MVFIDDHKENVEGARDCGWNAFHYQNNEGKLRNFLAQDLGLRLSP